jgi:hypothetical protein
MFKRLNILLLLLCGFSITHASDFFSSCRFHFGTEISKVYNIDNNTTINAGTIAEVDYFTGPWAGSSETFNLVNYFKACKTLGKTPVVVAYIIAFAAKRDLKIDDCNVSQNNLCKKGAGYIRNNRTKILNIYSAYAKGIASTYGTDKPVIWCMEPDYSQYTESMQEGGGISYADAGTLMSDIISTVKKDLPKSMFSMDISPWKDTTWQNTWYTALNVAENFSFINTSGGSSKAASSFISDDWAQNLPKWAWVLKRWNKPVIADAGYGVNGGGTGHDSNWDNVNNLNARITDGVIGVSQYNPKNDWAGTIQSIRSQLPAPPSCPSVAIINRQTSTSIHTIHTINNGDRFELIDFTGKVLFTSTLTSNSLNYIQSHYGNGSFLFRSADGVVEQKIFVGTNR